MSSYARNQLLSPKLGKPKVKPGSVDQRISYIDEFLFPLTIQNKSLVGGPFKEFINRLILLKTNTKLTLEEIGIRTNAIYKDYFDLYDYLISSKNYTINPKDVRPEYLGNEIEIINEYNQTVLLRAGSNMPITRDFIPPQISNKLPPDYYINLEAYNNYIVLKTSNQLAKQNDLNFDVNKLLVATSLFPVPKPPKQAPTGFTEIGVNTFFKKLESTLKTNYSDMMGEYIIPGSDKPCKLFMDKNYNYVVVQGDKRQVFKDPIEARRFCLLGGFDADKVQKFRSSQFTINKLDKPFRIIPKVNK